MSFWLSGWEFFFCLFFFSHFSIYKTWKPYSFLWIYSYHEFHYLKQNYKPHLTVYYWTYLSCTKTSHFLLIFYKPRIIAYILCVCLCVCLCSAAESLTSSLVVMILRTHGLHCKSTGSIGSLVMLLYQLNSEQQCYAPQAEGSAPCDTSWETGLISRILCFLDGKGPWGLVAASLSCLLRVCQAGQGPVWRQWEMRRRHLESSITLIGQSGSRRPRDNQSIRGRSTPRSIFSTSQLQISGDGGGCQWPQPRSREVLRSRPWSRQLIGPLTPCCHCHRSGRQARMEVRISLPGTCGALKKESWTPQGVVFDIRTWPRWSETNIAWINVHCVAFDRVY